MYQVSILVPIYRVENYIERCVRSLMEQTYPNIQYVFVDDCSPDMSIFILKKVLCDYEKRIKYIKIVSHLQNRGLAAARNSAIENATGSFVCHVDSDDYLERNAIELLVNEQIRSGADIVSCNSYMHTNNGIKQIIEPNYKNKEEMVCSLIRADINHTIWRRLINISLYRNNNVRAEEGCNQGEDWQVFPILTYYAQSFSKVNHCLYHYECTNQNSHVLLTSNTVNEKLWAQDLRSMYIVKNFFYPKGSVYKNAVTEMEKAFLFSYLFKSAYLNSRYHYNFYLEKIFSSDIPQKGWNNMLCRYLIKNYTLIRLYIKFKRIFNK